MKTIWKCVWFKADWNAYWGGGNWIVDSGEFYALTKERAQELCPITPEQGKIYFTEHEIIT